MKTSDQIDQVSKAMSIAQGEMKPASKSTLNPFFKSKYSTLAQVWEVIREPMSKNNLSIFQNVSTNENGISITTRVCHASGQWIEFGPLIIPLTKKDAQGVGSAISYGKRYSLSAAIGVVSEEEDDDGEAAMGRNINSKPKEKVQNVSKAPEEPLEDVEILEEPAPIKYINPAQMKMFNDKYEQVDEKTRGIIDERIQTLNIPDLKQMPEDEWMKFMKSFEKYFSKKEKK